MNIQSFAMPYQAYFNPFAWGNDGSDLFSVNGITYMLTHIFFDQKFMTIFSLLFGVSMALMMKSHNNKTIKVSGKDVSSLYFLLRRNLVLLFIGLIHAYLVWEGDILVSYALCAIFVVWFGNKSVKFLIFLGVFLFFIPVILSLFIGFSIPEVVIHSELQKDWVISQQELQEIIFTINGPWFGLFLYRINAAFEMQTWLFILYSFWRVSALMLWGMVIYKIGLFEGHVLKKYIALGGFILISIGITIVIFGVQQNHTHQWQAFYSTLFGTQFNYIGSALLGGGYILAFMLFVQYLPSWLNYAIQCIGRTALSNYLLQSLICGFVFYGYGLGLFAKLDRLQILLIVPFVWLIQIITSALWLQYFHMGPVEWIWRVLVLREFLSIKK
ncbi:DUF418 domain-containing protein [Agarilytica rhodophyticola]|uniref:DUF418 domain-containing protein n=1 Tax=Agarilytica rhodophyticola TaxID=1737490 RepID=UPI00131A320F|nr:DUF418 domain-containing protein [Agarilytica rhodophyticola]